MGKRYPNGALAYFSYDDAGRAQKIHYRKSDMSEVSYFAYDYDAVGNVTQIRREEGLTAYYSYDDASRLTGEEWYNDGSGQIYAFAYDYDAVGNVSRRGFNGANVYYDFDAANKLTP